MPTKTVDLERIQRWFHASIMHPGGLRDGLESDHAKRALPEANGDLEAIVLPSNALTSMQRLSIYADMYFDRLIDILGEEFPSVRHLLGSEIFAAVVKRYVTQHPSTHPSLAQLGCEFPRFLLHGLDGLPIPHQAFAAAVATVERAMEDVFDEVQVEPLVFDRIQAIPAEHWSQARLKTIPALRLLELAYPVNDYISAVRDQRNAEVPAARRCFVTVYRFNFRVWRMDLDESQFTLLSAIHNGEALGEAVAECAELPGADPATLVIDLQKWFRDWTAEGFFHNVEIASDN